MNITDKIILTILILLGALTLLLSGSIIFNLLGVREMEGNYVDFVVWANLISSILYLITAFKLIKTKSWDWGYLAISFTILLIATIAFLIYVQNGGIHEAKTIKAIIFRTIFTGFLFTITYYKQKRKLKK